VRRESTIVTDQDQQSERVTGLSAGSAGPQSVPLLDAGPDVPTCRVGVADSGEQILDAETAELLRSLPKELGVLLVSVGFAGLVLPGLMGAPAMIAGGMVLWPRAFGKVESWFWKRYPESYRSGGNQIKRFLADLERRYPGSLR
jgi:hypothetical protein